MAYRITKKLKKKTISCTLFKRENSKVTSLLPVEDTDHKKKAIINEKGRAKLPAMYCSSLHYGIVVR